MRSRLNDQQVRSKRSCRPHTRRPSESESLHSIDTLAKQSVSVACTVSADVCSTIVRMTKLVGRIR